jgi:membrane-associated phospholipid phosphatase
MRRYVSLYLAGLFFYITYPMAPPWMASRDGYIPGDRVSRLTGRGWEPIGLEHFQQWLSRLGNQVAAMPSLHAATAALIAFYGIARLRSRWRYLLIGYPLAMGFMLVYYGEHYVVDIVAGWLLAGFIMWACTSWERGGVVRRVPLAANAAVLAAPRGDAAGRQAPVGAGFLGWLRTIPGVIVPTVLVLLVIVGLMGSWYSAVPALLIVLGFLGWLTAAVWPEVTATDRRVRVGVLVAVAALLVVQLVTSV